MKLNLRQKGMAFGLPLALICCLSASASAAGFFNSSDQKENPVSWLKNLPHKSINAQKLPGQSMYDYKLGNVLQPDDSYRNWVVMHFGRDVRPNNCKHGYKNDTNSLTNIITNQKPIADFQKLAQLKYPVRASLLASPKVIINAAINGEEVEQKIVAIGSPVALEPIDGDFNTIESFIRGTGKKYGRPAIIVSEMKKPGHSESEDWKNIEHMTLVYTSSDTGDVQSLPFGDTPTWGYSGIFPELASIKDVGGDIVAFSYLDGMNTVQVMSYDSSQLPWIFDSECRTPATVSRYQSEE